MLAFCGDAREAVVSRCAVCGREVEWRLTSEQTTEHVRRNGTGNAHYGKLGGNNGKNGWSARSGRVDFSGEASQ